MSALTDAVRSALGAADMLAAATDVKQLVCDELARVDPDADIHRTDYFNHSYIPDVVVRWPAEPAREVFLRFMAPDTVQDDVQRIGKSGPVVVDLSMATTHERSEETTAATSTVIEDFPWVLITDTEATAHVRPGDAVNFVEHLVVSNLLRAGRGQLTEPIAKAAVVVSRAGFDGAATLDGAPVRAVISLARALLNLDLERRVEKSLQLLWWAGGGAPAEFPVSIPDDMQLNPSDTRDFLRMVFTDTQQIDDSGFWGRLADRMDFDMLVDAGEVRTSQNLNRLMKAFAGRLVLSHAVLNRHERPFPPDDQLTWSLADHFLELNGPDWSCRFTPHGNRFSQRRDEGTPVSLSTANERSAGLLVEEAEIQEATRLVHLTRTLVEAAAHRGTSLSALTQGFPDSARVRGIVVQVGEHRLTAEFDRMMVASTPDSPVLRMATVATQLLASLTQSERHELAEFLEV